MAQWTKFAERVADWWEEHLGRVPFPLAVLMGGMLAIVVMRVVG